MIPIDTIVVPQGTEYQAVCRGLKKARANNVRVIPIPIGTRNIEQTLFYYRDELNNTQHLLIMGLCGSLSKRYSVGDTVLYQSCRNLKNEKINLKSQLTTAINRKLSVGLVDGLTGDRIVCQAQEKIKLSQAYPVSVLDMEGYSYIKKFQKLNIEVAMLRVISDDLMGDIPDLSQAVDCYGNLKTIPMAIAFMKQPHAAIRLIKGALAGLKTLKAITTRINII